MNRDPNGQCFDISLVHAPTCATCGAQMDPASETEWACSCPDCPENGKLIHCGVHPVNEIKSEWDIPDRMLVGPTPVIEGDPLLDTLRQRERVLSNRLCLIDISLVHAPTCEVCNDSMDVYSDTEWMCQNPTCEAFGKPVHTGVYPMRKA